MSRQIQVIYVLGSYRSGSTILSKLLGQGPTVFCAGELKALWRNLSVPDSRCGCGSRLVECPIWLPILQALAESRDLRAYTADTVAIQRKAVGWKHTWLGLPKLRLRPRSHKEAASNYAHRLKALYEQTARTTGATTIVDASKDVGDAVILSSLCDLRVYFVHIVRDPRAVVYSHYSSGQYGEPSPYRSAYLAASWVATNVAAARLCRGRQPATTIRYEDLARDPEGCVRHILGDSEEPVAFNWQKDEVALDIAHTVDGNPNRFGLGPVAIEEDLRWRDGLRPTDRRIVNWFARPLMGWYDYQGPD